MSGDGLGLTAILDATSGPDRLLRCGACSATLIPNLGEPPVLLRARARVAGWRFFSDVGAGEGARCLTHRGDVPATLPRRRRLAVGGPITGPRPASIAAALRARGGYGYVVPPCGRLADGDVARILRGS